jgi:hypothetical protein
MTRIESPPLVSIGPGMWTREIPPETRRPTRELLEEVKSKLTPTAAKLIDEAFPRESDKLPGSF